jgi:hypothetical protein
VPAGRDRCSRRRPHPGRDAIRSRRRRLVVSYRLTLDMSA